MSTSATDTKPLLKGRYPSPAAPGTTERHYSGVHVRYTGDSIFVTGKATKEGSFPLPIDGSDEMVAFKQREEGKAMGPKILAALGRAGYGAKLEEGPSGVTLSEISKLVNLHDSSFT